MPTKIRTFQPHPQEMSRHARYDQKRRADPLLARVATFRSSSAWQCVRMKKRKANPICEDPYGDHRRDGSLANTESVHHVISLRDRLDLGLVWGNLRGLCWSCHNKVDDLYDVNPAAAVRLFLTEEQEAALRAGERIDGSPATGEEAAT